MELLQSFLRTEGDEGRPSAGSDLFNLRALLFGHLCGTSVSSPQPHSDGKGFASDDDEIRVPASAATHSIEVDVILAQPSA